MEVASALSLDKPAACGRCSRYFRGFVFNRSSDKTFEFLALTGVLINPRPDLTPKH